MWKTYSKTNLYTRRCDFFIYLFIYFAQYNFKECFFFSENSSIFSFLHHRRGKKERETGEYQPETGGEKRVFLSYGIFLGVIWEMRKVISNFSSWISCRDRPKHLFSFPLYQAKGERRFLSLLSSFHLVSIPADKKGSIENKIQSISKKVTIWDK